MQTPFSIVPNGDSGNSTVIQSALNISLDNSKLIDNVQPLIANTTFPGEVRALEKARTAYLQYLQYDGQMRTLLQQNNLTAVSNINTGVSDQTFAKFIQAMQDEHDINQQVFESVWERQKSALWLYPLAFGVVGYGLVILLVLGGAWHRYREL